MLAIIVLVRSNKYPVVSGKEQLHGVLFAD